MGMTRTRCTIVVALSVAAAPGLRAQETGITIYGDGTVLVRRTVPQAVPDGAISTVNVPLGSASADPGSFIVLDTTVALQSVRVLHADDPATATRRAVGHDVDFWVTTRDTFFYVRGRLLSADPFAVRIGGRVLYAAPGPLAFPDSLPQVTPRAELTLLGLAPTPALHVSYFTRGLSWRALLTVIVPGAGGGAATVDGSAVLEDRDLRLRNVAVQLASGDIRRAEPPQPSGTRVVNLMSASAAPIEPADNQAVAETRVYSLPNRLDLEPGVTTASPLFARAATDVERWLVIDPAGDIETQWTARADSNLHPVVHYFLHRPDGTAFGETPLPQAVVRLLAPDSSGNLELVGEAPVGATPKGRDVELVTGSASDVVVDRVQTAWERHGDRDVTVAYRVTVHNGKDEAVTVAVNEAAPGQWDVLTSSVPADRVNASQFRFLVPVPARSDGALEYRLRIRW